MAKLKEVYPGQFCHWCPGCQCTHHIYTEGKVAWNLTGGSVSPTVRPSLGHNPGEKKARCHYHITEGKLEYFLDCFHEYRGLTIEMPDWDERYHNQYVIRPSHVYEPNRNRSPLSNMVCGFDFNKGE